VVTVGEFLDERSGGAENTGTMNMQDKAQALNALAEISIRVRPDRSWYVFQLTEIKNGSILEGRYGNGNTPDEAIEAHWENLTNLAPREYIVINASKETRRAVRWNGFMWETVTERLKA